MNDHTAGYAELPRTAYLDHTLRRARTAAEQRSHRYVTLEHLLLALLDDPDAVRLIHAVGADLPLIKSSMADMVNNRMGALAVPDGRAPGFSYKFDSLFLAASQDAIGAGRREVDGSFALIAVSKERDSHASAILAANGFSAEVAFRALNQSPPPPAGKAIQSPPRQAQTAAAAAQQAKDMSPSPDTSFMEDMLASVRSILDAEEKDRGPTFSAAPAFASSVTPAAQPRLEPRLRGDLAAIRNGGGEGPSLSAHPSNPLQGSQNPSVRPDPGLPLGVLNGRAQTAPAPAQLEPHRTGLEPEPAPKRADGKRKPQGKRDGQARRRGEQQTPAVLERMLESIPRRFRKGSAETVRVQLTREEAQALFTRSHRQGQPQFAKERRAPCRAITIRLSAPEGGLLAEALSPETQWIFEHPPRQGQEDFGVWAWTVLPGEKGSFALTLSLTVRDIDGCGLAGDLALPEQSIGVRVRGSVLRATMNLLSEMLLLVAGSGLTVGAWYALKVMGKLPH